MLKPLPSLALLNALLIYDRESGEFFWRVRVGNKSAGDVAGCIDPHGYRQIHVGRKRMVAHRIAWLLVHGEWPNGSLDHINLQPADNRMCNLCIASVAENGWNSHARARNKSGFKWVSWHGIGKCWQAKIRCNGVDVYLGLFRDPAVAHAAAVAAAAAHHGQFARAA